MKKVARIILLMTLFSIVGGFLFYANYGTRGSGISLTEVRDVEPFQRVTLEGYGLLNISIGEVPGVSVTTDDNLVEFVATTVNQGGLLIRPVKPLNPKVDLVIDIVVPELTHIELAGAARLNLIDYQGKSLDIEIAGACGAVATGQVDRLILELAGACRARMKALESRVAVVEVAGTGSAVVFASESLDAEAAGIASITCHGNPTQVKKEADGISRVTVVGQ